MGRPEATHSRYFGWHRDLVSAGRIFKEAQSHEITPPGNLPRHIRISGFTEARLNGTAYDPDKSVKERLGSSSRYGFKYGDPHLWKPLSCVQYYLDSEAARVGLLSASAERQWQAVKRQMMTGIQ